MKNELADKALDEGKLALGCSCYYIPEMLVPLVAEEKTETLYDKFFGVFMKLAEFARNILAKLWEILGKK